MWSRKVGCKGPSVEVESKKHATGCALVGGDGRRDCTASVVKRETSGSRHTILDHQHHVCVQDKSCSP